LDDAVRVVSESSADAIAMADILHYERSDLYKIRDYCEKNKINVRNYEN